MSLPVPRRRMALLLLAGLLAALVVIGAGAHLLRAAPTATLGQRPAELEPLSRCEGGLPSGEIITSSASLLQCPERYDGRTVTVAGEAIGQIFGEGRRRWVQLNDDPYAFAGPLEAHHQTLGTNSGIAVLLPEGVELQRLGGAGTVGDRLEVTGTFKHAAPEDQGGPALIADEIRLLEAGLEVQAPLEPRQAVTAALLAVIVSAIWLDVARAQRRR